MAQAASGFLRLLVNPQPPRVVGPAIADVMTGFYPAPGILAALNERHTTGKGRVVETSMFEAMCHFNLDDFTHLLSADQVMGPHIGQHERKFLLRPAVLTIGSAFLASMQIEQAVLPPLQALRDQTGDSASPAVLAGTEILYVAHVSTDRRFRVAAGVGTRFPFHATSLGKALAANLPDDERGGLLAGAPFQRFTERTVTDPSAMAERLALIGERRYDSAPDGLDYGIVSVAVPLFGRDRRVIAAINCSTSTTRISQDELVRTRLPLLRQAASEIEAALKRWPLPDNLPDFRATSSNAESLKG